MKSVVKNLVLHAIYLKIMPIVRLYNVPFQPFISKVQSSLNMAFNGWVKGQVFWSQPYARGLQMCRFSEFNVTVFGRFSLKCPTYSFIGALEPDVLIPLGL